LPKIVKRFFKEGGVSGYQGASGYSGYSGVSGFSGFSGSTGAAGMPMGSSSSSVGPQQQWTIPKFLTRDAESISNEFKSQIAQRNPSETVYMQAGSV
jgi:hypothetical protein